MNWRDVHRRVRAHVRAVRAPRRRARDGALPSIGTPISTACLPEPPAATCPWRQQGAVPGVTTSQQGTTRTCGRWALSSPVVRRMEPSVAPCVARIRAVRPARSAQCKAAEGAASWPPLGRDGGAYDPIHPDLGEYAKRARVEPVWASGRTLVASRCRCHAARSALGSARKCTCHRAHGTYIAHPMQAGCIQRYSTVTRHACALTFGSQTAYAPLPLSPPCACVAALVAVARRE